MSIYNSVSEGKGISEYVNDKNTNPYPKDDGGVPKSLEKTSDVIVCGMRGKIESQYRACIWYAM